MGECNIAFDRMLELTALYRTHTDTENDGGSLYFSTNAMDGWEVVTLSCCHVPVL